MQNICPSSKLSSAEVIQKYFAENRSRVLEIAAFLDRLDRSAATQGLMSDPRIESLRQSIAALLGPTPDRLLRIQHLLSDHSELPLTSAPPEKSASGVPRPSSAVNCC